MVWENNMTNINSRIKNKDKKPSVLISANHYWVSNSIWSYFTLCDKVQDNFFNADLTYFQQQLNFQHLQKLSPFRINNQQPDTTKSTGYWTILQVITSNTVSFDEFIESGTRRKGEKKSTENGPYV